MENEELSISKICAVLEGKLEIGHRPKLSRIAQFKSEGFTHVVTILSEKEGAKKITSLVRSVGLTPIWIDLGNAKLITERRILHDLKTIFADIQSALLSNGQVYLHCSAGIHRTGMITNALLLYCGFTESEALSLLDHLRPIIRKDVGLDRLAWGRQFLQGGSFSG